MVAFTCHRRNMYCILDWYELVNMPFSVVLVNMIYSCLSFHSKYVLTKYSTYVIVHY